MAIAPLSACLFLGGGTMPFQSSDAFAEAICLPFALVGALRLASRRGSIALTFALAFFGLLAAIPLLQLIPLPPSVWMKLPGRGPIVHGFELADMQPPWLGLSLSPAATRQGLFSLLAPFAVFVNVVACTYTQRRRILACVLAFAFISVLLGLAQAAQGMTSPLRFYYWDENDVVGFFGNRNHFAALMYVGLGIAAVFCIGVTLDAVNGYQIERYAIVEKLVLPLASATLCLIVLVFGLAASQSRAGVGLGIASIIIAIAATLPYARGVSDRRTRVLIALGAIIVFGLSASFFLLEILARLKASELDPFRNMIAGYTLRFLFEYMPVGAGVGSFIPIYASHETPGTALPAPVNRAHNDFLEWSLETGYIAPLMVILALTWLVWRLIICWRERQGVPLVDAALARMCAAAPALLLLHSWVDYPLRTLTIMGLCATCCAIAIEPVTTPGEQKRQPKLAVS